MTHRQFRIVNFILRYQREHGMSPDYREIAEAVGLKSWSSVRHHINRLKEKGYIAPNGPWAKRALQVLRMPYERVILYG